MKNRRHRNNYQNKFNATFPSTVLVAQQWTHRQSRNSGGNDLPLPAAPAEFGHNGDFAPPSPHNALSSQFNVTGAPRQQPFSQQQQTSSAVTTNPSQISTGPSSWPQPGSPWTTGPGQGLTQQPASAAETGHLPSIVGADHDYVQRPGPLTDHNYFMSVPLPDPSPRVNPPPGFSHGRPRRNRTIPVRFRDYELDES